MIKSLLKQRLALLLALLMALTLLPVGALAEETTREGSGALRGTTLSGHGVEGLIAEYENGTWTVPGSASIRGSAKTSKGSCGNTTVTATLTLTNALSATSTLSFNWSLNPTYGTLKINGNPVSGTSGTESIDLASQQSTTVVITSADSNNGISSGIAVILSNISLSVKPINATVTFIPGEHGSFTLDGTPVTSSITRTQLSTIPYVLAATPDAGYEFNGWYDITNSKCLSTDNPATLNIDSNITVQPKFIPEGAAVFQVGTTLYLDLNEANTAASSASNKTITLVNDGTLFAGNYTISSGVTLLIPYNNANTIVTSIKTSTDRTYHTPTEFRKLTMADGANITVNGKISVAAEAYSMSGGGSTVSGGVTGPYGCIDMLNGSSITLNSGAYLYAYGYVIGSGNIIAKSGSVIKECFQLTEFRGGTALSSLNGNSQKVFPMSQYYVQNIEAPTTFQYGAKEQLDMTVYAAGSPSDVTNVAFIGSTDGLFKMSSGSTATKRYDPREDRLILDIYGDVQLGSITISLSGVSITSSRYVLPINSNIDLNIHSGTTTVGNATQLLPGVRVTVDEGAAVTLNSGTNLFVYDSYEWLKATNGYDKYFGYLGDLMSLPYTPTRTHIRNSDDLIDVFIDVNGTVNASGNFISTAHGANITSSRGTGKIVLNKVGSGTLYQCSQSGSDVSYHQISVTSVQLKNGAGYEGTDEEYVQTGSTGTGTYYYNTNVQKWYKYKVDYVFNSTIVYTDYTAANTSSYAIGGLSITGASATNGTASVSNGIVNVSGLSGNSTVTLTGTAEQYIPVFVLDNTNAALYQSYTGNVLSETVTINGSAFYVVQRGTLADFGTPVSAPSYASMGVNSANHNTIVWKLRNNLSSQDFSGTVPAGTENGGEAYIYGLYSGAVASVTANGTTLYYSTLYEAFLNVPSGASTVTLLADCGTFAQESHVASYSVLASSNVTFDLNGHAAWGRIVNKGTLTIEMNGGSLEYITGATAAAAGYQAMAAVTNSGNLTIQDSTGGGRITADAISDSGVPKHSAVVRNYGGGTMSISNVTLENLHDVNSYVSVVMNDRSTITALTDVTILSPRGYAIFNYGGNIQLIDSCTVDCAYGIYNRNVRGTNTFANGYNIANYGTIGVIRDSDITAGQYAIHNGAVINELNNSTFTAHPDSAQVNTYGTTAANVQGNVQCYTVFNSNNWWYDTNVWKRVDVTSGGYTRTDTYKEEESCRPRIDSIIDCRIYAENTSTNADHGCALYNNGGIIGTIGGTTEIKTYKHQDNAKSIASNYALRNTAGGIIRSIEGTVLINASGYGALYNDGQFTLKTVNTYGDKIGGVQLHNVTTYGQPSEIESITANGTISAGSYYAIMNSGHIVSIASSGLTVSANYNALLNSGSGAVSSYDFVRTYTSNTDASTETKRTETYVRNLEKGGVIDTISGVHFVGTGTNSYYLLQNQGYIGTLKDSDFTATSPRAGEGYPMFLNGDSRQAGHTLTCEPFAYGSFYITPYAYHYDYSVATIDVIDNITLTKNATFGLRNLGRINTIKNSTFTGTQYVFVNTATGPYTERDHVRYYSGTTKFAKTKNNGSDLTSSYARIPAEIGAIENVTITGTSTYALYNGGHIGSITGSGISSTNTTVLGNVGATVLTFDSNILDIISEVTATDSACTVVYGNDAKVNTTTYQPPVIDLIGEGSSFSGTYQVIVNLGDITAIDGGSSPVTVTSTTQKQIGGIYSYTGTLAQRINTTPYTDGTAGTATNQDTYLSAHIGSIKNTVITANGIGIQNGSANVTYFPTIDELGDGLEIHANCTTAGYHAVYNTTYAKITAITGGIYSAATATTNAYKNNNTNPEHATLISGGHFKGMAATRANAIFEPDNTNRQTYPEGLNLCGTESVTFHDGTSADGYYFIGNHNNTTYTVTWKNWDGTTLETDENVSEGATPTYDGATPTKPATAQYTYAFNGWTPAIAPVTGDVTYTATFTETLRSYTITWIIDGVTETETYQYGATPTHADPTKEATAQYTYTFTGWSPAVTAVTGDATYTAQFSQTVNSYTITWKMDDGSVIDTTTVEYGVVPTHSNPTKTATAEYIYTFAGWTPEVVAVTGDATYTATFSSEKRSYTITWKLDADTVIDTTIVEYGAIPTHANPTKAATAEYTYTFAGWDPEIATVTGDATYTAQFSQTVNTYTITWVIDGNTETETYEYGATPTHADPTKEATAQYTYTFTGWTPEIATVTGDATYTAQFSQTVNTYTVTWVIDGNTETETYAYGAMPTHADPTKDATAQYTYTFAGWSPEIATVTGDATYTAQFSQTVNSYTITWIIDGTAETETYQYGATPSHTDPEKEANAQYSYAFNGWTPAITEVTGDATYTAQFSQTVNSYTITWVIGGESETETYAYGATPTHADPTKEATAQYTYTFTGWTPEIATVTGDATYTAVFTETVNTYTVTWKNWDGAVLRTDTNVPYGTMPVFNGAEPTKPATDEYNFAFNGWTPVVSEVTGDAIYTAVFISTVREYAITFVNEDGTVLQSGNVAYGTIPNYTGVTPTKAATAQYTYTFTGWTPEIAMVTGDATYTAQFSQTVNTYTVTWVIDGNIETETYAYGAMPTHADPTKAATAQYTYAFNGWTPTITEVTGDATYTAVFTETVNSYTITWIIDGNTETETYEYGAMPTHADPAKEATAQYTYTFNGWTPTITEVTGDATYTAQFEQTVNSYTITWIIDGTTETETYEYGAMPAHADPTKAATAQYTYAFTGWSPEIATVTGDATYTAQFSQTVNSYTITWIIDGVTETETYQYGATPTHADPAKEATAQYTYTFTGWTPEIAMVTGEATYTAQFEQTINSYTITWIIDGESEAETYTYGATPTHADPTKEATAQYTYTFTGWTPEITAVTGDATYTAVFTETVNSYTVTWVIDGNTETETYEYGATPTHADPTKAATAQYTYTFSGWTPEIATVTGDATYTAQFSQTVNTYTITWVIDGNTETETYEYGATPTHADPTKEATAQYTYTFAGWTPEISTVTGDATYTAVFTETVNTYTVTFVDWDGTVLSEQTVAYGSAAEAPANPERDCYIFTGWDCDFSSITGDTTVTAQYERMQPTLLGDIDLDGEVSSVDALLALRYSMHLNELHGQQIVNGDMNGDGELNSTDAILIMRIVLRVMPSPQN